jgi:hypothetical protein
VVVLLFSLVASGRIRLRRIDGWRKIARVSSQHATVAGGHNITHGGSSRAMLATKVTHNVSKAREGLPKFSSGLRCVSWLTKRLRDAQP